VPAAYTAGILAALGGVIILVATRSGPETRGIDLHALEKQAAAV
jgi:hypothetical protein